VVAAGVVEEAGWAAGAGGATGAVAAKLPSPMPMLVALSFRMAMRFMAHMAAAQGCPTAQVSL
jgi:hypothetical protein